jgi:transcription-repair coupling factor (superfamily II helicase)
VVAGLADATERWLVVVDEPDLAERVAEALKFFAKDGGRVHLFPADDVRPYDGFSPHPDLPVGRLRTLHEVAQGGPIVVVAPAAALMQRVPDAATRARGTRTIKAGDRIDRDELVRWLQDGGYLATGRVEDPACFAVRGDIVDVWPAGAKHPVRIDLFDEDVEELRRLDPQTQRTTGKVGKVLLLPAREERLDEAALQRLPNELGRLVAEQKRGQHVRRRVWEELRAGIRFAGIEAWLPAVSPTEAPLDAFAGLRRLVVHPDEVAAAVRDLERGAAERWSALDDDERPLVPPSERYVPADVLLGALCNDPFVAELAISGKSADLGARAPDGFSVKGGELAPVAQKLVGLARKQVRVGLVADSSKRAEQLQEMLENHDVRMSTRASPWDVEPGEIALLVGDLRRGFVAETAGWAFIPAAVMFGERQHAKRLEKAHQFFDASVTNLAELKEGDFVVHKQHGVGLYRGLQRVPVQVDLARTDNAPRQVADASEVIAQDFVRVEYREGDLLLLPVTRLEQLSRFVPAHEGAVVKLDKLGGQTWLARRSKVKDSILRMASDLLALYAKRELAQRPAYKAPGPMYRAFEARFPYDETVDQAAAIDAINEDLGKDTPADRLVVGDVGYGKTEVAMRAAMRVVESGRQVAVLCPTSVLAFQHLERFKERFAGFPVKVEMLSRFKTPAEEKQIADELRDGKIDVVVGTTRLLGRGVKFDDLGLVVIDEEHRFGVKQKERLKKMRAEVDVLSMSATPIPRTLQMGLSGLREMSIIATPPRDRLAVRTTMVEFSGFGESKLDKVNAGKGHARVREAILHELARQGQVFFVHNRVEDIEDIAKHLRELVPEAKFVVAHGQMTDEALEDALVAFIEKQADVLVSSAIIESGVDLPNVNTMLVNRADRFGLAQLYQLRGRVGRGNQRASCILLLPEETTPEAKRRVRTLAENADLGAGFRIAMADLEMRGAGNLLGDAQSGNIDQVGYEAWLEILEEAVHEARGEIDRQRIDPEVEVPVKAFLPEAMFPDVPERLGQYRRLAASLSEADVEGWLDEMEGRFGELPVEVQNLAGMTRTKVLCRDLGIQRCAWLKVRVLLELHPRSRIPQEKLDVLVKGAPKRFQLTDRNGARTLEVRFLPQEAEHPFRFLRWVLAQLQSR